MAVRMRGKVISRALLAFALFTTMVSVVVGEQQHVQPCEGLITKPYMRGSGLPCMSCGDLATTTSEGTMLLPSRRMLGSSSDTAGSVGGVILTIVIIVAIVWCVYTGRCYYRRPVAQAANSTAISSSDTHHQNVTVPVSIVNQAPETKAPTVQYQFNYAAPVPAGDMEMIAATAVAGNALAHAQAGNHMGGGVPAGVVNFQPVPVPEPGFPAYAPPQHTPSQPQRAYQPNPLSNYRSDKSPGPKKP